MDYATFALDQGECTGHLHDGAFVNKAPWNAYKIVLGIGPAGAEMLDLDAPGARQRAAAWVWHFPHVDPRTLDQAKVLDGRARQHDGRGPGLSRAVVPQ